MVKLKERQFYCVICRKRVTLPKEDVGVNIDKAGKPRLKGYCKYCEGPVFKYIKWASEDAKTKKFGKI